MAALGVAFVVGGVGNMLGHTDDSGLVAYAAWPTWLSPIGWGLEMRPFGGDRWWLLALPLALCAGLVVAAARYAARRDLGRGLLPVQTGAAEASPRLRGPFGLAWRLQRAAFISWLVAMLCTGLIFGSISDTATTASGESRDWYEKLAGSTDMLASLLHLVHRDGRDDGRDLRRAGAAAHARGGVAGTARGHRRHGRHPAALGAQLRRDRRRGGDRAPAGLRRADGAGGRAGGRRHRRTCSAT